MPTTPKTNPFGVTSSSSAAAGVEAPWYQTAIIYQVHVRAFADSNADGIGDLNGLTSKLDYLTDLGVTALWLLPFYPSPLRDGGYDIADYTGIHPSYGTMDDFKRFLDEAHKRGLRVITELVINHTSAEHAWFQRARRSPPGSPERELYVWSDKPDKFAKARIIFKDFEASNWSWDSLAKQYYWHRFYSHQPDLNFDNPAVTELLLGVVDFWLGMGVDGMRLDAVPYLFEREGTSCENLPETHAYLKMLRAHVDKNFPDRMLLAEANQWPEDAAAYFGNGDECHMNFHFPLMPRIFMAVQMEDRFPIIDILRQTPKIPKNTQWATFLRNHDELTLEMVTDEERDYMYHAYSEDPVARINLGIRRRLAPLVKSRRKFELMKSLLFSLPGTPVMYYGDEIGMGDNIYLGDRDGVRTPMQWSADKNAGFSRANPQRLFLPIIIDPEFHYESVNVEAQQGNPASLLRWIKRLLDVRRQHPVLGLGDITFVGSDNPRVLSFVRHDETGARVLVVCNLSRHAQHVSLDVSAHAGALPVEMFGRARFPPITERPYTLALTPYGFYWFELTMPRAAQDALPTLRAKGSWTDVFARPAQVAAAISAYAVERRWYRGKAKTLVAQRIIDTIELGPHQGGFVLVVFEAEYADGTHERYFVPIGFARGERAAHLEASLPSSVIARIDIDDPAEGNGILYDTLTSGEAARLLVELVRDGQSIVGKHGRIATLGADDVRASLPDGLGAPSAGALEQTNSTVSFGERLVLKVFRAVEAGQNAEVEVGMYLKTHARPALAPPILGVINYDAPEGPATLGVIHAFVPNQGTAWNQIKNELETLMERVLSDNLAPPEPRAGHLFDLIGTQAPPLLLEYAGTHARHARLLGTRVAELHAALGTGREGAFTPEPFTLMHQQSLYQSARATLIRSTEALEERIGLLPEEVVDDVKQAIAMRSRIDAKLREIAAKPIEATRIRTHGDLHLGQVLATGDDFAIIDFEGEPARPLRERRYKRGPLRDVAGMIRSFDYVGESAARSKRTRPQDVEALRPWITAWTRMMCVAFLEGYVASVPKELMPADAATAKTLLDFFILEKCIYEIGYELNNRPTWLPIPLAGLNDLVP